MRLVRGHYGVILGINPDAAVVDITHEIRPGDIRAGASALPFASTARTA
ncbi:MAG: SAM-dependent chlorinase/fluorinase [Verrucomicrobiota bacterium]